MKKISKIILDLILRILFRIKLVRASFKYIHFSILKMEEVEKCKKISPGRVVLSGPFKGLKYPAFKSAGSSLLTKLIGSYEDELYDIINEILKVDYSKVIDIGCAEGYYAIGLAVKMKNTVFYAFDTDLYAQRLCRKMSLANNVSKRVYVKGLFTENDLSEFDFKNKGLVISDCEGYEFILFTQKAIKNLHNCDILVEIHDDYENHFALTVIPLFKETHSIQIINSNNKKKISDYEGIKNTDLSNTDLVERPIQMQWAFMKSKET